MSGMRSLTVKRSANGDRVQCSFHSDRSLSHSSELNSLMLYVIDVLCSSNYGDRKACSDPLQTDACKLFVLDFLV